MHIMAIEYSVRHRIIESYNVFFPQSLSDFSSPAHLINIKTCTSNKNIRVISESASINSRLNLQSQSIVFWTPNRQPSTHPESHVSDIPTPIVNDQYTTAVRKKSQ